MVMTTQIHLDREEIQSRPPNMAQAKGPLTWVRFSTISLERTVQRNPNEGGVAVGVRTVKCLTALLYSLGKAIKAR